MIKKLLAFQPKNHSGVTLEELKAIQQNALRHINTPTQSSCCWPFRPSRSNRTQRMDVQAVILFIMTKQGLAKELGSVEGAFREAANAEQLANGITPYLKNQRYFRKDLGPDITELKYVDLHLLAGFIKKYLKETSLYLLIKNNPLYLNHFSNNEQTQSRAVADARAVADVDPLVEEGEKSNDKLTIEQRIGRSVYASALNSSSKYENPKLLGSSHFFRTIFTFFGEFLATQEQKFPPVRTQSFRGEVEQARHINPESLSKAIQIADFDFSSSGENPTVEEMLKITKKTTETQNIMAEIFRQCLLDWKEKNQQTKV